MTFPEADGWLGWAGIIVSVVLGVAPFVVPALRRRRPVKRSSQRGAWERVSRVRELAEHTSGTYLDHVVKGSLKAAVRADAQAELRALVFLPFVGGVAMLLLTVLMVLDDGPVPLLNWLAPALATVVYIWVTARNALLNESNRQSIDALVEQEEPLLLTDPWTAVETFRKQANPEKSQDPWVLLAAQRALNRRRRQLNRVQWTLTRRRSELRDVVERMWSLEAENKQLREENERLKRRGMDDGEAGREAATAAE